MSDFIPRLPERPSFEQLRKQASERLRELKLTNSSAKLADAQFALAREHGFPTWAELKHFLETPEPTLSQRYELLAHDIVAACQDDAEALARVLRIFGAAFSQSSVPFTSAVLRAKLAERLKAIHQLHDGNVTLAEAQLIIARQHGVATWSQLKGNAQPYFRINWKDNSIEPGPVLSDKTWDVIFSVMKERKITSLNAGGRLTDSAMKRLAKLDHVTHLNLGGCLELTDSGLAHLALMPQLRELSIDGWKGQITDEGLKALAHLRELRRFEICWQQHVSDVGLGHLAACHQLETVNLLGTPAGDGTIAALAGKAHLTRFTTGRNVTDDGIAGLHDYPNFRSWQGGEPTYSLMSPNAGPTHLVLDGPFTDSGLARLKGLDGLFALSFFWHCPNFTSQGLKSLAHLPRLGFLGCQDAHCDDEALHHIAALPQLRMLMGQGATATSKGFKDLSRSHTLEYLWGRDCPNFDSDSCKALSKAPALRGLAISCKNVDDAALALLAKFPKLREFVPMDITDHGFRHVGHCEKLEALWCMYCRETGDAATEHLARLNLKSYYVGASQITDRSLEILGRMSSLEKIEFWQCLKITDEGVAHLTALPKLKEVVFGGLPGVTLDGANRFRPGVDVTYSS